MAKGPGKERIDVLLVERGLCETRSKAQARILAGEVIVDDQRVDKAGTKVSVDADLRLKGKGIPWVSRGGLKLEGALQTWPMALEGVVAIDVGASTGGFTDVLLSRGAGRVYAVDVGYGQLAWKLQQDDRVVNMERTHIAKLEVGTLDPPPTAAVIDVSFISLDRVLPALDPHLARPARVWALIKPQFEVGKDHVGKGGIVRDVAAREAARDRVLAGAERLGWQVLGYKNSPITGTDGNVEYVAAFDVTAPVHKPASQAGEMK
jgi:23S rRNA (cytidine1920-2'-O)/16S rRNA (cytidine1409-2'-O)-methyltransferase